MNEFTKNFQLRVNLYFFSKFVKKPINSLNCMKRLIFNPELNYSCSLKLAKVKNTCKNSCAKNDCQMIITKLDLFFTNKIMLALFEQEITVNDFKQNDIVYRFFMYILHGRKDKRS